MSGLEWKQPPTDGRSRDWPAVAAALTSRPGEWARIATNTSASLTTRIRQGAIAVFQPAGTFEARSVSVGDGKFDVYARFVGADS